MKGQQRKDLIQLCEMFDIIQERQSINKLIDEGCKRFQDIRKEGQQWLKELREEKKIQAAENQSRVGPLLPQTPTMKRKLRKRKIPPVEDEEKENTAYTRSRRAASQIANSKFHQQLHVPIKMRRPSSPKSSIASVATEPTVKRPRIGKNLKVRMENAYDSDEDMSTTSPLPKTSVASTVCNTSITSTVSEVAKTRSRKKLVSVEAEEEVVVKAMKTRTRAAKKAAKENMTINEDAGEKNSVVEAVKTRPTRNKPQAEQEEKATSPKKIEVTEDAIKGKKKKSMGDTKRKGVLSQSEKMQIEDMEITATVEESKNDVQQIKLLNITLHRLPENLSRTVNVTPSGTIITEDKTCVKSKVLPDDMELTLAPSKNMPDDMELTLAGGLKSKTPLVIKKSLSQVASTDLDLLALTPHLRGIVKERVIAVEKSLKKDEPVSKIQPTKKVVQKPVSPAKSKVSVDMFESAESSQEDELSPTKFETKKKKSSIRKSGKKSKSSLFTPNHPFVVKLFDKSSLNKKRSRSQDTLASSSKVPASTTGRARVLTGMRTFAKANVQDVAKAMLEEEQKKRKAEENQRILERAQDAAKKKEEQLRLKREQKKKENMEKRAKAVLAQEARAREQEEALRLEREREERKAALQRAREEKEQQEKEQRKEQRKQKQQEREQRRKEEEAARLAKAKEIAIAAEERQKELKQKENEKGGWAPPPGKIQIASKIPAHQPAKQLATASSKNALNETFEVPPKVPAKKMAPKPPQAVTCSSIDDCYVMTPCKDDMPPLSPINPNDYGIEDVNEDDPSDDDEKPKKKIPDWARNMRGNHTLLVADWISIGLRNRLFGTRVFKPTAQELFGSNARPVHRRSSAVWNTPPNIHHQSLCESFLSH